jgi:hypothetical protein
MPTESEAWLIEEGDRVIRKCVELGCKSLDRWEALVHAFWWADYAVRNGESLVATDAHCAFHAKGLRAAEELSLPLTRELFALALDGFEGEYLDRFEAVCDEIRAAERSAKLDRR